MQLKLSVGDEMLTIDVKPTDTFQDISERLCSLGNIKVDMNQLRSSNNDKPFDMTTNVIEYFTKTVKVAVPSRFHQAPITEGKPGGLCRLCGNIININPHFLFGSNQDDDITLGDKVNSSLPIHVSKKDPYPKQVCENCIGHLEESYDFVRTVLEAQAILESRVKPGETFRHTHKNDRCPLCNNGFLMQVNVKQEIKGSKKGTSEKGVTVQVPKSSAVAKTSYKRPRLDDENAEYYQSDEVVTGYWEPRKASTSSGDDSYSTSHNSYPPYGSTGRKYRKRMKGNEDDQDWTIDEEYIPVSRRGRPKGTKNKPKVVSVIQKTCVLCDWTGADLDMLAHTINLHCQPDLGYFPCPMCKTRHANEMDLETHIEEHNMTARKMK